MYENEQKEWHPATKHFDLFKGLKKNCIYRHSCQLPDSASPGVVFRLRISPRIRSQNRNGSKLSAMDHCRTGLCKNPRKSASLPCPFSDKHHSNYLSFHESTQPRVSAMDEVFMEGPIEPNMGPSLADVLLCNLKGLMQGFLHFL
jgi:hypothetical protein